MHYVALLIVLFLVGCETRKTADAIPAPPVEYSNPKI